MYLLGFVIPLYPDLAICKDIMKSKLNQRLSTTALISTKLTITSRT